MGNWRGSIIGAAYKSHEIRNHYAKRKRWDISPPLKTSKTFSESFLSVNCPSNVHDIVADYPQ